MGIFISGRKSKGFQGRFSADDYDFIMHVNKIPPSLSLSNIALRLMPLIDQTQYMANMPFLKEFYDVQHDNRKQANVLSQKKKLMLKEYNMTNPTML